MTWFRPNVKAAQGGLGFTKRAMAIGHKQALPLTPEPTSTVFVEPCRYAGTARGFHGNPDY